MSYRADGDLNLSIAQGKVSGKSSVVIIGHNPDIDTAAAEMIWPQGGIKSLLSAAETMNIVSTSVNDASAGTGLRTLLITGVDGNFAEVSETVTMNGTTNVVTSNSYCMIHSMQGVTAGSGSTNAGAITATATTAATVQASMLAGDGITQDSSYTVPAGKTLYVTRGEFNAVRLQASDPFVNFVAEMKDSAAGANGCWINLFEVELDTKVENQLTVEPTAFQPIPEKYTLRVTASTSINNLVARCRIYGTLVDDVVGQTRGT